MTKSKELQQAFERLSPARQDLILSLANELALDGVDSLERLLAVLSNLTESEVRQLLNVARVMALPIEEHLLAKSKIVTPPFAEEFRARLQAHHATHTTPMDRLSFENAFLAASRASGRATEEAPSRTTRFFDATVDGKRVALKTEGAKSMKADQLHISKLSEAAWIQDMRSGRRRHEMTIEFLEDFLANVDQIFVLRYYRSEAAPHYELVEIPITHFALLRDVPVSAFNADAPRIALEDSEGPIMEFRIDRSDSKITIGKIRKNRCLVHGEWLLSGL
jgi:hypothetical protein